jgi:hypothetical protein
MTLDELGQERPGEFKVGGESIPAGDILKFEIISEVDRQMRLWGTSFDDKNTANDWVAYICNYVASGAYSGRQAKYTPTRFREHLVKAAALCVSAILAIDRNGDCAPRHYEMLPRAGAKE